MQHKREAFWFYRFLSMFYDDYVNPLFWTEDMRDQSLEIGKLDDPNLRVIDVGSGTGFTTQGIVKYVPATNVTCVDQSPHQMEKAKQKADLQGCTFKIGDAENIPVETDSFDRYVSAGSIEYWPDPQQGIAEAYRVIKPGGTALLIGPLEPAGAIPRFFANLWMLFPKDEEYRRWYEQAGFTDIEVRYVRPHWHTSKANEYGIAIAGRKPQAGLSPAAARAENEKEKEPGSLQRGLQILWRVLVGSLAGFIFIPIAILGYLRGLITGQGGRSLSLDQIQMALIILGALLLLIWLIF